MNVRYKGMNQKKALIWMSCIKCFTCSEREEKCYTRNQSIYQMQGHTQGSLGYNCDEKFTFELTHYEHYSSYYFCFRVEILYVVMLVTFKSFYSTYWFSLYLFLLTLFLVSVYIVYPEFLCIPLCLPSPVPGHIYPKVQK